jgi:hypothetical protein
MAVSQSSLVPTLHSLSSLPPTGVEKRKSSFDSKDTLPMATNLPVHRLQSLEQQNITYHRQFVYSLYFQVLVMPHENNKTDLFLDRGHLYHSKEVRKNQISSF